MDYELILTENALTDIEEHKRSGNQRALKKIASLLKELCEHPFTGTGKPEALKHQLSGLWSRRISQEHRLVYEVNNQTIYILTLIGHY